MAKRYKKIVGSERIGQLKMGTNTYIETVQSTPSNELVDFANGKFKSTVSTWKVKVTKELFEDKKSGKLKERVVGREYIKGSMRTKTFAYTSLTQSENGFDRLMKELQSKGWDVKGYKKIWDSLTQKQKEEFFESYRNSYQSGNYASSSTSERSFMYKKGAGKYIANETTDVMVNDWIKNSFYDIGVSPDIVDTYKAINKNEPDYI